MKAKEFSEELRDRNSTLPAATWTRHISARKWAKKLKSGLTLPVLGARGAHPQNRDCALNLQGKYAPVPWVINSKKKTITYKTGEIASAGTFKLAKGNVDKNGWPQAYSGNCYRLS